MYACACTFGREWVWKKRVNWRVCECEWMKESRNKEWTRIWHRMVFDGIFVPFPFYLYVGEKKAILMAIQKIYPSLINIEINTTKMKLVAWKRRKNAIRTKTTSGPIYKPVSHNVLFSCVLFFPLKPELLQRAISRLFKHKFTSLTWYCCIVASEREEFINM